MKINVCALTDIGKERSINEDAVAICQDLTNPQWNRFTNNDFVSLSTIGAVAIIADGMGGANAGEMASNLAIKNLEESFRYADYEKVMASEDKICLFLKNSISVSNKAIINYAFDHPDCMGLGTTIVLLWLVNSKAYIAWCGDSRCYCFNPKTGLKQLTKDHSLVQELVDKGDIQVEDTFTHPDNNIVTRCLGDVDADSTPEIITYDINDGDVFLLCSDGLCGYCSDNTIQNVLYKQYDNIDKCQLSLLRLALKAGGQDNISISLCATQVEERKHLKDNFLDKIKRIICSWW